MFTSDRDVAVYARWLREGAEKYEVSVHGWVFMTNHVHLLLTPADNDTTSRLMQHLGRRYVRYFNFAYSRSGTLFEGRFRSSLVEQDAYFLACLRYIELNPVRAGMVVDPADYKWSSYTAHASGVRPGLWSAHPTYLALGRTGAKRRERYRAMFRSALSNDVVSKIRHCVNSGLVLGSEEFREQIDTLTK